MAYQLKWQLNYEDGTKKESSLHEILAYLRKDKPTVVAFDTETTGLNIVRDRPFLFIMSWKIKGQQKGRSFVIKWDPVTVQHLFNEVINSAKWIIGANTKYDLHMMRNGGYEFPFERLETSLLTDVMIYRRLTMNVDASKNEDKMGLKAMSVMFIDEGSNDDERNIAQFKHDMNHKHRSILNAMLKPYGMSSTDVNKAIEDSRYGLESLPPAVQNIYTQWVSVYGEASYDKIWREHPYEMNKYAVMDGVLTIEVFLYLFQQYNYLSNKVQNKIDFILQQESKLIQIYYQQEKTGLCVDMDYLVESKRRVSEYNLQLEQQLHFIMGEVVSENQHQRLVELFVERFKEPITTFETKNTSGKIIYSLNKAVLSKLMKRDDKVGEAAKIISKLRRCRKWLSTYIDGIYKAVRENGDGRLHPLSNSTGTISGRISGDMQQMPKDPLKDLNDVELFHPRKIIKPSGSGYKSLVLQDFDQMELRVQANYMIDFSISDPNFCRIFIPYNCVNKLTGKIYDINSDLANYNLKDNDGNSVWLLEDGTPWTPLDPHGMHVKTAFGLDKPKDDTTPEFKQYKHLRNCAKIINFASIYGSGLNGLIENEMLEEYPNEIIEKIYNSFKSNFPGVLKYQEIVSRHIKNNGLIANKYARYYVIKNPRFAYKCANYLIQGSCADLVKSCLISIDKLLKANKAKSRMLYTIHDEIMWELYEGEEYLIKQIEFILNNNARWSKIPLTCGTDLAVDNWANKKDISNFKEIA